MEVALAVAVATAVVGYGAAVVPRRTAAPQPSVRTAATTATSEVTLGSQTPPVESLPSPKGSRPSVPAAVGTDLPQSRPRAALTTSTLASVWQRQDTRSLERAFSGLRRETLVFHRCGMQMTESDHAVARCEGSNPAVTADQPSSTHQTLWTIDFQRTSGRWAIASVTGR